MSMTIVCLHGNPGDGAEFDRLITEIEQVSPNGFHFLKHRRPVRGCTLDKLIQSLDEQINTATTSKVGLLAYSWGAYLALAYLTRYAHKISGVFLVNPHVLDKKPLGPIVRGLAALPLFNILFLKLVSHAVRPQFIENIFYPHVPSEEKLKALQTFLSYPKVWQGMITYKNLIAQHPLAESLHDISVPIHALLGELDVVASVEDQLPTLKKLPNCHVEIVPQTGHSLLVSNTGYVAEQVVAFFK